MFRNDSVIDKATIFVLKNIIFVCVCWMSFHSFKNKQAFMGLQAVVERYESPHDPFWKPKWNNKKEVRMLSTKSVPKSSARLFFLTFPL